MAKKTKHMVTSLVFSDDGIELHNIAVGDANDHCEEDVAEIRAFLEGGGGVEIVSDQSLACDTPATNTGVHTGNLKTPTNRTQTRSEVHNQVQVEED